MTTKHVFKGREFYTCPKVVVLPVDPKDMQGNYLKFGRIAEKGGNAVPTEYFFDKEQTQRVHAVPIELNGHSLTNLAYGADGYMYLADKGRCFRARYNRRA